MMVVVVPPDEILEPVTCMKNARKVPRIVRVILHRFEVRLREGVVVEDIEDDARMQETPVCSVARLGMSHVQT